MNSAPEDSQSPDLPPAVAAAVSNGRIVEAIKLLRADRGIGLKEAKEAVDRYLASQPALKRRLDAQQAEAMRGCLLWLAGLIAIATVAYFVLSGK